MSLSHRWQAGWYTHPRHRLCSHQGVGSTSYLRVLKRVTSLLPQASVSSSGTDIMIVPVSWACFMIWMEWARQALNDGYPLLLWALLLLPSLPCLLEREQVGSGRMCKRTSLKISQYSKIWSSSKTGKMGAALGQCWGTKSSCNSAQAPEPLSLWVSIYNTEVIPPQVVGFCVLIWMKNAWQTVQWAEGCGWMFSLMPSHMPLLKSPRM